VTWSIDITVVGTPVAQGSKKAFVRGKRAVVVDTNSVPLDQYRSDIRNEAQKEMEGQPLATDWVNVTLDFIIARPKSHYTTKGALTKGAPTFPSRPDIDKAVRACLDALTDVVYVDDGQVTGISARKRYGYRYEVASTYISARW